MPQEATSQELQMCFGRLLAAHRADRGWTQARLANESHLGRDMIAQLEGGRTGASFPTIARLASALDIEPVALFSGELARRGRSRERLDELYIKLVGLDEEDAEWALQLIEIALSRKP